MKFGKHGISSIVAILVVILLVSVAAGGAYVLLKNDDTRNAGDSLIQRNIGIGSTFIYETVSAEINHQPVTASGLMAEIIGQSGDYYVMLFSGQVGSGPSANYYDGWCVMVHCSTGELRFSSHAGTDSVVYDGNNISLNKWEWVGIFSSLTDTVTFSSSPQDAIPYKISIVTDDWPHSMLLSYKLTQYEIKKSEEYTKPNDLGKGLVYVMTSVGDGKGVIGNFTFIDAGRGSFAGTDVRFVISTVTSTKGGKEISTTTMVSPVILHMSSYSGVTMIPNSDLRMENAIVVANYDSELFFRSMPVRSEAIDTIDGKIICDVYEIDSYGSISTMYVGKENSLVYCFKQYNVEYNLKSYINP